MSSRFHWLEIAEYILLMLNFLGIAVAIITSNIIFSVVFIFISLVLNIVNRSRIENRIKARRVRSIRQLEEKIESLEAQIRSNNTTANISREQTPPPSDPNIDTLTESLSKIIEYLNNNALPQRIENLEELYASLNPDTTTINLPRITYQSTAVLEEPKLLSAPPQWEYSHELNSHTKAVNALSINEDGSLLVSGSWDQTLKLWDLGKEKLLDTRLAHDQGILAIKFLDKNNNIASGSFDHTIKVWSVILKDNGDIIVELNKTLRGHTGSIHSLDSLTTSKLLISGSYDKTLKQWNWETGQRLHSSYDELGSIYAVAVQESSQVIACGGGDGSISLWKLITGEYLGALTGNISSVQCLAISKLEGYLVAGCVDGTIKVWSFHSEFIDRQNPINCLMAHSGQVTDLVITNEGYIISSGADGALKMWHPLSTQPIAILETEDNTPCGFFALALSKDNKLLAVGGADGVIRIWLVPTS